MPEALRDFPEARWEALAELLIRKRVEISPRYHKRSVFAREHGLNYRLILDIERHTGGTSACPRSSPSSRSTSSAPASSATSSPGVRQRTSRPQRAA